MSTETTISGHTYGLLTAVQKAGRDQGGNFFWLYRCACGREAVLRCASVKRGTPDSCGCKYGKPGTNGSRRAAPLSPPVNSSSVRVNRDTKRRRSHYIVWAGMKNRCYDQRNKKYHRYGGRGIRVCSRWLHGENGLTGFDCFCADMGPRPEDYQIERKDNDGHYEPGNCRWASRSEQSRNRVTTRFVTYQGKLMPLADAFKLSGVTRHMFRKRTQNGWTEERALDPSGKTSERVSVARRRPDAVAR